MALIPTNASKVQAFAGALYGVQIGSTTMAQVNSDIASMGMYPAFNAYFSGSFGSLSNATVAAMVAANLGITGANGTEAATFIAGELAKAGASKHGETISGIVSGFSTLTSDAKWGPYATAWNAKVETAAANTLANDVAWGAFATNFSLSAGLDLVSGTAGNDVFVGNLASNGNTLQSGDTIKAGADTGADTMGGAHGTNGDLLYATLGNESDFAILANTTGVEAVAIRSQSTNSTGSSGTNNVDTTGDKNTVDAERMVGVQSWWNTDSRADLKIEDIRILDGEITKDINIVMRNTDPGSMGSESSNTSGLNVGNNDNNVDYEVYFSHESLRAQAPISTQTVTVYVASQLQQSDATKDHYDASKPLANLPYDTLNLLLDGVAVTLNLTYTDRLNLTEAGFESALRAAVLEKLGAGATVTVNVDGYSYSSTDFAPRNVNTYTISVNGKTLTTPATNTWNASAGLPTTNAFASSADATEPTENDPLITSSIILDNVGREGEAGSLTVGGMDTRGGVERFEIKVASNNDNNNAESQSGSWISRAQSTNNTLREVSVNHVVAADHYNEVGVIDNREVDANIASNTRTLDQITNANADYLIIGTGTDDAGNNLGQMRSWPGLVDANGLRDVRLFDASAFKGDIKLGAFFDAATVEKYQDLVDSAQDDGADDVEFLYNLGSGNDSLNVTIDPAALQSNDHIVAGRHDFDFNFNGNGGDDHIQVEVRNVNRNGVTGTNEIAWYNNQDINNNITINGGAGNDVIRKPGAGNTNLLGGSGNDTIYAENTGSDGYEGGSSLTDNWDNFSDDGIVGNDGFAEWAFNAVASTVVSGTYPLENLSSANPVSVKAVNATVTVNYMGFDKTVDVSTNGALTNSTITDLTVNQAIKNAINNDQQLNKLLIAEDGPGRTLIISSLIDGEFGGRNSRTPTGLEITLGNHVLTTAQAASGVNLFDGTEYSALGANATTGLYAGRFADTSFGSDHDGADSSLVSDNVITPGTGNDVMVLGTAGYLAAGNATNQVAGSNDIIVYSGYEAAKEDTIVYFDTTWTPAGAMTSTARQGIPESVVLTFGNSDGSPAAQTLQMTGGALVTLSAPVLPSNSGVIPGVDVAYQWYNAPGAIPAGWTASHVAGTNVVTLTSTTNTNVANLTGIAAGGAANLDFGGTYFGAGNGNGSVAVSTTDGQTAGALGTTSTFSVTFTTATTAALAGGSFTFDGTTVSYPAGAGSITLEQAIVAADAAGGFAHWSVNVGPLDGQVNFTSLPQFNGQPVTLAAVETAFKVDAATPADGIVGFASASQGTADVNVTWAPSSAAAQGQGFDQLDFSSYGVKAVVVDGVVIKGALVAGADYISMVTTTGNAGEYKVSELHTTDAILGGDSELGVVGTLDFGTNPMGFVADSFII